MATLDNFLPDESARSRQDLRDLLLFGAGVAVLGGGLWWALNGIRMRGGHAPGSPGETPHWAPGGKDGVGTAISNRGPSESRVWFTIRDGVFTEIFYPRADTPAVRELRMILVDSQGSFFDERSDTEHEVAWLEEGVPAFNLINTCRYGRFRIEKEVLTHPRHDVVLQSTRFLPLSGTLADYRLFVYLSPQLDDQGALNSAWIGQHKGMPVLFAERHGDALALACSTPWRTASAGFVGRSDGLADLRRHGALIHTYQRAEVGNVALTAEVDLQSSGGQFVLALGFGTSPTEAAHRSRTCLLEDFSSIRADYLTGWRVWQNELPAPASLDGQGRDLSRVSLAVLRTHEDKCIPGAVVAGLSVPWGAARSDDGTGLVGYHIVWPRDAVQSAGGLLAAGSKADAIRILRFLHAAQEADGHWAQNFWVDGETAWDSNQMGETALPILLVDLIRREAGLNDDLLDEFWPMVRAAASFIVRSGPSSQEDRWEDVPGFTPYTLAALVAALLVASSLAERQGDDRAANYLRDSADNWCDNIEYMTYVQDTPLSRRVGVPGYYLRVAPPDKRGEPAKREGVVNLSYQPEKATFKLADAIVSPDALAYVRFGLRAADDPRIVNTVKVIDAELRVETPGGPSWTRSSYDGYGEKADGAPFDNVTGIGRAWPLLTGERAHYELAAGRRDEALRLLHAMEYFANETGMIPEQVWDAPDIPSRGLYFGRPNGSAMPLAWAHAEYLKLRRSLAEGRIFDMPPQTYQRYVVEQIGSPFVIWRSNYRRRRLPQGKDLRVELLGSATIHWRSHDGVHEVETFDTGMGIHCADLATNRLSNGSTIHVQICEHSPSDPCWEKIKAPRSFQMTVTGPDIAHIDQSTLARETTR